VPAWTIVKNTWPLDTDSFMALWGFEVFCEPQKCHFTIERNAGQKWRDSFILKYQESLSNKDQEQNGHTAPGGQMCLKWDSSIINLLISNAWFCTQKLNFLSASVVRTKNIHCPISTKHPDQYTVGLRFFNSQPLSQKNSQ